MTTGLSSKIGIDMLDKVKKLRRSMVMLEGEIYERVVDAAICICQI